MNRDRMIADIQERGWTEVPFNLSETDRAEYAMLANRVISIAIEDEAVNAALRLDLMGGSQMGAVRTGLYEVGRARNSADNKIYLHAGFQSEEHADSVLPLRSQPQELRSFWTGHAFMMDEIERSMRAGLNELGATGLADVIFADDISTRNVHLRTVRYINALAGEVGEEVVSGHADLGCISEHLFETHSGWFMAAPYPVEHINDDDTPERRTAVREVRANLETIRQDHDTKAMLFLGANWHTVGEPYVPTEIHGLPACYHAGFKPDPADEVISDFAQKVTDGADDRVSVVVFGHPNIRLVKSGEFTPATVPMCRPTYEES